MTIKHSGEKKDFTHCKHIWVCIAYKITKLYTIENLVEIMLKIVLWKKRRCTKIELKILLSQKVEETRSILEAWMATKIEQKI